MPAVRAKKYLGQHFLTDTRIATRIVDALQPEQGFKLILEVGPGMGILTDILLQRDVYTTWLVDVDKESVDYLAVKYPDVTHRLLHADFLQLDFAALFRQPVAIIGNFPYNISSQILFKILENRQQVPQMVGMFQKEVAERCTAHPGSKVYGILSVLTQAFYSVEYLFTVKAGAFNPPPKVLSGVIRLTRNKVAALDCDEALFFKVVKAAFNQRRKTLRNALSGIVAKDKMDEYAMLDLRAEQLGVADFVLLTKWVQERLGKGMNDK